MNENLPTLVKNGSVTIEEWRTRVDLAACYRLMAHFGMDDLIYNHISARVPGPDEHFLLNPFGLLYEEITASNLVKVDLDGNLLIKNDPFEGVKVVNGKLSIPNSNGLGLKLISKNKSLL